MPQNYSYYLLVGAWLQGLLTSPRGAIARVTGKINNVCPREDLAVMEKSGKYSPRLIAKLRRRQAAHDNYYEAIGVFSASVVAANAAGVNPTYLNASSLVFLLARIAHFWTYVNIDDNKLSFIRSGFWWIGNLCFLTNFVKAGLALNKK